jgi:hypothetical protein
MCIFEIPWLKLSIDLPGYSGGSSRAIFHGPGIRKALPGQSAQAGAFQEPDGGHMRFFDEAGRRSV